MFVLEPIEDLLSFLSGRDDACQAEFGKVLRHGGGRLAYQAGEAVYRQFAGILKAQHDAHSRRVREHPEHFHRELDIRTIRSISAFLLIYVHTQILRYLQPIEAGEFVGEQVNDRQPDIQQRDELRTEQVAKVVGDTSVATVRGFRTLPRSRSPRDVRRARMLSRMVLLAATQPGKGRQGLFQRVLLGGLLVATVVTGLLAMHILNLHGTPAAHRPAAISVSATGADEAHHLAAATHESSSSAGDLGSACTDCGSGDHVGMAMACVLALLLILLILVPPRLLPGWIHTPARPILLARLISRVLSRAPSLHVLCISRT